MPPQVPSPASVTSGVEVPSSTHYFSVTAGTSSSSVTSVPPQVPPPTSITPCHRHLFQLPSPQCHRYQPPSPQLCPAEHMGNQLCISILPFISTTPGMCQTVKIPFLQRLEALRAGGRGSRGCLPSALRRSRRQSAAAAAGPGPVPSAVPEAPSPVPGQGGVKGCGDVRG